MLAYLRLALLLPLFRQFFLLDFEEIMLDEEDDAADDVVFHHADVFAKINVTAYELARCIKDSDDPVVGFDDAIRVYRRNPSFWGWLKDVFVPRHVHMMRLVNLKRPLWLGEDGRIYFGYDCHEYILGIDLPSYCMEAELLKRTTSGLERVLRALEWELSFYTNHH